MTQDMTGELMWGMAYTAVLLLVALVLATFANVLQSRWAAMSNVPLALLLVGAGAAAAAERPASFVWHSEPRSVPELQFVDGEGQARTLGDFRGKVVLLNVWATWCPPCRQEMPALDALQATLGGPDFAVVALSVDRAGANPVRRFYDQTGVKRLALYLDVSGRALRDLGAVGLPTTLLIDRGGREIGRLIGPTVWDAPEMVEALRQRVATNREQR